MKNLLNYQSSEYDCGPVSLTNAVRYLFEREDSHPTIIKYIMLCCMDSYNEEGEAGKRGTSSSAMNYLSSWLNQFGKIKQKDASDQKLRIGTWQRFEQMHEGFSERYDDCHTDIRQKEKEYGCVNDWLQALGSEGHD